MNLDNIKLGHSPLTNTIHLYRHGKDVGVALDKRDAIKDVQAVLIEYMLHGMPKGAKQEVCFGDQWYEIQVKPVEPPKHVEGE